MEERQQNLLTNNDFAYRKFSSDLMEYFGEDVIKNWFHGLKLLYNVNSNSKNNSNNHLSKDSNGSNNLNNLSASSIFTTSRSNSSNSLLVDENFSPYGDNLSYQNECNDGLILGAPTSFIRDWIQTYYFEKIQEIAKKNFMEIKKVIALDMNVYGRNGKSGKNGKGKAANLQENSSLLEDSSQESLLQQISYPQNSQQNKSQQKTPQQQNSKEKVENSPIDSYIEYTIFSQEDIDLKASNSSKNEKSSNVESIETHASNLNEKYNFDTYVTGKANEFAYAAARRVAEQDDVYNPLFFCGKVGMGKTHLMHAIGLYASKNRGKKVLYTTAETFMYDFVNAIRHQTIMDFKKIFRSVDILMIDDIQFIADKGSTQEELFHTWNSLIEQNKQVIVSADKFPGEINGIPERMKSRLSAGLVAVLHEADYELRLSILHEKVNSMQEQFSITLENGVLELLAESIISNIRELEGMFLNVFARNRNGLISLEDTRAILNERYPVNTKFMNVDDIKRIVADHYNIRVSDLITKVRTKDIARARQVAMFLTKNMTTMSLPSIGKRFGGRDHTTVMHAVKSINELLSSNDSEIQEDIKILKKKIMID